MLTIELPACTLRPFRAEDVDSLVRNANNRRIWINVRDRFPHPYTAAHAQFWIEHTHSLPPDTQLAIAVDGQAVGCIGIELQSDIERVCAEIGFWLGEPYWDRGIMTQAVKAYSDWALRRPDLYRLYASVFEWNRGSMRVLEKAGYRRETVLQRSAVKDDRIIDRILYGKTR
jgi:ribosomal-protein-alanine N-acetyltransferase